MSSGHPHENTRDRRLEGNTDLTKPLQLLCPLEVCEWHCGGCGRCWKSCSPEASQRMHRDMGLWLAEVQVRLVTMGVPCCALQAVLPGNVMHDVKLYYFLHVARYCQLDGHAWRKWVAASFERWHYALSNQSALPLAISCLLLVSIMVEQQFFQ